MILTSNRSPLVFKGFSCQKSGVRKLVNGGLQKKEVFNTSNENFEMDLKRIHTYMYQLIKGLLYV